MRADFVIPSLSEGKAEVEYGCNENEQPGFLVILEHKSFWRRRRRFYLNNLLEHGYTLIQ